VLFVVFWFEAGGAAGRSAATTNRSFDASAAPVELLEASLELSTSLIGGVVGGAAESVDEVDCGKAVWQANTTAAQHNQPATRRCAFKAHAPALERERRVVP
jgi:hypothetical protein